MYWSLRKQIFWFGLIFRLTTFSQLHSSSLSDIYIEDFFKMEANMISKLEDYSIQEQERLDQLKKHLQDWKKWRNSYTNQKSDYFTIPQNLFHLFKKLTMELHALESLMKELSYNNAIALDKIKSPSDHHLKQAVLSLVDLQYQYDLKSEDIMNGTLMDLQLNTSLPSEAYYFIGQTCFEFNIHLCVVDWLKTRPLPPLSEEIGKQITKLIYSSHIFLNQTENAYYYAQICLKYDIYDNPTKDTIFDMETRSGKLMGQFRDAFEANRICRGEYSKPPNANLKCRYNHENSAFLKIAPLKEEELNDAPRILFYRDVIYDSEIELVKNVSAGKLEVGTVFRQKTPRFAYRQGQTAFFEDPLPSLDRLDKLTEDIAGQRINLSEPWQVVNYAPGGFYSTHSDFLDGIFPANNSQIIVKNRLTTMLFYLDDVTLGGETVFPRINVSATPTKGAALFWSNIHANGSRNFFTDHSACPVVIGEKWGFTKWIWAFQNPQCHQSLRENDEKTFAKYHAAKNST